MTQNIKGFIKNRPLLFSAVVIAILFGGFMWVNHAPGVEAVEDMVPNVCYNNTADGGACGVSTQCQSNLCIGGNGPCGSGTCGTLSLITDPICIAPPLTGSGGGCSSNSDCSQTPLPQYCIPSPNSFGCPVLNICSPTGPHACTTGMPTHPEFLSNLVWTQETVSGQGYYRLSLTIPPQPANGTNSDYHDLKVVIGSFISDDQFGDGGPGQFLMTSVEYPIYPTTYGQSNPSPWSPLLFPKIAVANPQGPLAIEGPYGHEYLLTEAEGGEGVVIGVRNYDSCQGVFGQWLLVRSVPPPVSGGGTTYSCTGTQPASPAVMCTGDDTGLTGPASWQSVLSCTSAKCEAKCPTGASIVNGQCACPSGSAPVNGACVPSAAVCTGVPDINSSACPNDAVNVDPSTPWVVKTSCSVPKGSAPKCERTCVTGFTLLNGVCMNPNDVENFGIPENGNVFGYAWSDNIGWIKMNNCSDVVNNTTGQPPFDGVADNGSCTDPKFGVKINSTTLGGPGQLSGHAWSDKIGWIRFGTDLGTPPSGMSTATLSIPSGSNVGTFSGWGKSMLGGLTPGFTGWLSLAGTNYLSGSVDGSKGTTYDKPTARIVGYAWGGEVTGWVNFTDQNNGLHQTTYGAPAGFDYTMTVSPDLFAYELPPAGLPDQDFNSTIDLKLTSGASKTVSLVAVLQPTTAENPPSISLSQGSSCNPPCKRNLKITAHANTTPGQYDILVSSPTAPVPPPKHVYLTVPSTFSATCTAQGNSPYDVNTPVTWEVNIDGAVVPDNIVWNGTNVVNGQTGSTVLTFTKIYSTTGVKTMGANVTVGTMPPELVSCDSATVIVKPDTQEF